MAVGTIATSVLTDIANAIRFQAGVATTYRPREMAAAVAALDGTRGDGYRAQPYMELESGVMSESVFADIADAIRGQNGLSVAYAPGEMAQAILDLTWDVGLKLRAVLLSDGTLEFNYTDRRRSVSERGAVVDAFEVDPAGYSAAGGRPWDGAKSLVRRAYIDSSVTLAGITSTAYWFNGCVNLVDVFGFDSLSGVANMTQMFTGCSSLETIWAYAFTNAITSSASMFYGCTRLVGGYDGFVPSATSAGSVCKLGAGGVLTSPFNDKRTWFWAHYYADGVGVLTASEEPEAGRGLVASGRICANARYQGLGFTPWDGATGPTHRANLRRVEFAADMAGLAVLNLDYLLYSCTAVEAVSGLGNLGGVRSMRYAFASCGSLSELDFRGFDPSALTDLFYCFSGCSALARILADATWALPASGVSGSQCFYGCSSLVGGAGTAYASSRTAYTYFRIDAEGAPGYLTAG